MTPDVFVEMLCTFAAGSGHLAVLKWARANVYPWDDFTCWAAEKKRATQGPPVCPGQWLPLGRTDMLAGCPQRTPQNPPVGIGGRPASSGRPPFGILGFRVLGF